MITELKPAEQLNVLDDLLSSPEGAPLKRFIVIFRHREDPIKSRCLGTVEAISADYATDMVIRNFLDMTETGMNEPDFPEQFELYDFNKATDVLKAAAEECDRLMMIAPIPEGAFPERKKNVPSSK